MFQNLVEFCPGTKVEQKKLKIIEERPLSKTEDGTFVKELAVLIFGHKTLYNSSLTERKYSSKDEEAENKRPRRSLDSTCLEAIRSRFLFPEFKRLAFITQFLFKF